MAPSQRIVTTVMPRGLTLDAARLPVSVLISPRLTGAPTLASFGDWLTWTQRCQKDGIAFTFAARGNSITVPAITASLQPALWAAIFNNQTLVDDFAFRDLSGERVISYPTRLTLTLMKSIFQIGAVELVGPRDTRGEHRDDRMLRVLLDGLAVQWSDELWGQLHDELAREQMLLRDAGQAAAPAAAWATTDVLGGDGLPDATELPAPGSTDARNLRSAVATRFSLYHHMPHWPSSAPPIPPPDWTTVLDFHKAISALQSYPALLRALGLVFDLDLPDGFLAATPAPTPVSLAVTAIEPGWQWSVAPNAGPPTETAVVYFGGATKVFGAASKSFADGSFDPGTIFGLLNLDPRGFGLVQVDVDGALHKTMIVAGSIDNMAPPLHPEVFDETSTLPSLRSAGLALVADERWIALLEAFQSSKAFNDALESDQRQPRPFYAEDLTRGFRLDVWDSTTASWHSLHRRDATYTLGEEVFRSAGEEGYSHLAVAQGAPGTEPVAFVNDLYLQEAIARWNGWSLSVPPIGKSLSRFAQAAKAVPVDGDPDYDVNPAVTPFPMSTDFQVVTGSLPSLRFGRRYRMRARAVDLAGNSLGFDTVVADELSRLFATPRDSEGFAYLRFEPVVAPTIVPRTADAIAGPGSAVDRLVIRTANTDETKDTDPGDATGSDRHIVPPSIPIKLAEHLGMLDDSGGKLRGDAAMYNLLQERDEGSFPLQAVPGQPQPLPVVGAAQATVPYLPDVLARSAALRDLPGSSTGTIGVAQDAAPAGPIGYTPLEDPNPRPGSATLVPFEGAEDWTKATPFRLVLADGDAVPQWAPAQRLLTVSVPKASTRLVALSSAMTADDLKLMGVWQWFQEYVQALGRTVPQDADQTPGSPDDRIAHAVQLAVEGGHWMLTPPHILTLVNAVQQPIGHPSFEEIETQHDGSDVDSTLQSLDMSGPTAAVALDTVTAWREPAKLDAYLMGALKIHGASTSKVDITAKWDEPVDDPSQPGPTLQHHSDSVDEIVLHDLAEGYVRAASAQLPVRSVGWYNPSHDLVCFVRSGDVLSATLNGVRIYDDAAPRHHFGDTKHRTVSYTALATSRFQEYFAPGLDFTRTSEPVTVQVPASARPAAPVVRYVVPTFGWERQTATNVKRSVRLGGGLRVYLDRPWYSSGADELLGVVLYNLPVAIDREPWKPFVTQFGMDPIWDTSALGSVPWSGDFALSTTSEDGLSLEEPTPQYNGQPGSVSVAGHAVGYDADRKLWYADIVVDLSSEYAGADTYGPFIRLALARYQPFALDGAKLSRVVLADFAQLPAGRSLIVTADPYHPRTIRVTLSGPVPNGPAPDYSKTTWTPEDDPGRPTRVTITVQERDAQLSGDLAWRDAGDAATVTVDVDDGRFDGRPYLAKWAGSIAFNNEVTPGSFRLLVREYEYVSANYTTDTLGGEALPPHHFAPGRLIYAETVDIDESLVGPPPKPTIAPPAAR